MSLFYTAQKHPPRHTVERRYPVARKARTFYLGWIPSFGGMTRRVFLCGVK